MLSLSKHGAGFFNGLLEVIMPQRTCNTDWIGLRNPLGLNQS